MSDYFKIKDDGSVLAAVMLGYKHKTEKVQAKKHGRVCDKTTYVCTICDRPWEIMLQSTGQTWKKPVVIYSEDILRYKKKRKTCLHCLKASTSSNK